VPIAASATPMDAFSYLTVLLSIIIGLAITQVLKGVRGLMQGRSRLRVYWPAIVWAVLVLVIAVQSWWAMFGMRIHREWTFFEFSVLLVQAILDYLLAALVLPDFFGDAEVDLRAHYFGHHRWFFAMLVLLIAVSIGKEYMLEGRAPHATNLAFHLAFAAGGVCGMATRDGRVHALLAILSAIAIFAYIGVLFVHLE
jgi:hypothetical protein